MGGLTHKKGVHLILNIFLENFVSLGMKKLMLLTLLIFGCEDILESIKEGCTIETSCNYDDTATIDNNSCDFTSCLDCLGYQNGIAVLDSCGVCDATTQNDCTQDCAGTWGGVAVTDSCGNCSSDNILCGLDCMGTWGGSAVVDSCDVCSGDTFSISDCTECDSGLTLGCDGICSATPTVNDVCEVCGGDGSTCLDCAGIVNGLATTDNCGTCDTDTTNDCTKDCAGIWGGSAILDNCGVCEGNNGDCVDCLGEVGGSATVDNCGTCDNDTTNDCIQDVCGVWNGDNSTCIIDLQFAIIKSFEQTNWVGHLCSIPPGVVCEDGIEPDCACICGGDAIEQTYYWDSDGDGLGAGDGELQCNGIRFK